MSENTLVTELLDFWFSESSEKRWFNSTSEFDELLRNKYLDIYQQAKAGELDDWKFTPEGALALVIIFDQLPLNIFREQAESFATESQAIKIANYALQQGFDRDLTQSQKAFLYMPFMHSEDMDDQNRSVALYEKANLQNNLRFAKHHRGIIEKFGRFPHRNRILGRTSTADEIAYLDSPEAFHG